jgi:hypothetical protein
MHANPAFWFAQARARQEAEDETDHQIVEALRDNDVARATGLALRAQMHGMRANLATEQGIRAHRARVMLLVGQCS